MKRNLILGVWLICMLLPVGLKAQNPACFHDANGYIIAPDGNFFVPKGINVADYDIAWSDNGAAILSLFPAINFVRFNMTGHNSTGSVQGDLSEDAPSGLNPFITTMTNAGVIVEIEDHYTDFQNSSTHGIPTGPALTTELQWYGSVATAYKNNPYVWFGSMNEPGSGYALTQTDLTNIALQQIATYATIRNAGNANPLLLENGGGGADFRLRYLSNYAAMTNIIWDCHYYDWMSGYSADPAVLADDLDASVAFAQSVESADGTAPVIIGEYGPSTDGTNVDAGGSQLLTAVQDSGFGSAAWTYNAGVGDDLVVPGLPAPTLLTSYGAEVAAFIASSGPFISSAQLSGRNLNIAGSGGTPNGTFTVQTNANLEMSSWGAFTNGTFDGSGNFSISLPLNSTNQELFYRIHGANASVERKLQFSLFKLMDSCGCPPL
jgi:hypothetical protein